MCFLSIVPVHAQNAVIDASSVTRPVTITISPRTGSFVEGSTFEVPLLLDTKELTVNGVEI